MARDRPHEFRYDVSLSFAGEDRGYVSAVADGLREKGVRVFYDEYEKVDLWGKDLYEHLSDVYRNAARYCVLFASRAYAAKLWPTHERRSAQARAVEENREYILPARFDDTEIPGLLPTIGHINLREHSPEELVTLIVEKVGRPEPENYLPPRPDRLFKILHIEDEEEQDLTLQQAAAFLNVLARMADDERKLVFALFLRGCVANLPEDVHINMDLLRREIGFPRSKILRLFSRMKSLGFESSVAPGDGTHADQEVLTVHWHLTVLPIGGNLTGVVWAMIQLAGYRLCDYHASEALRRNDFSQLASSTAQDENEDADEDVFFTSAPWLQTDEEKLAQAEVMMRNPGYSKIFAKLQSSSERS